MSISTDEVDKIAKLARLKFSDDEKQTLQKELSDILNYVDQLKELEDKSIESTPDFDSINMLRDDVVVANNPEEFLLQAPDRDGNFFKVKSVLD